MWRKAQAVEAGFLGEVVHQAFVRDGRLRHAEAAEGAGGRVVGVNGARAVQHIGHAIGAGAVHGHAARHRRAPGGVGAGVEIAVHGIGEETALGIAGGARGDFGGVALGGGSHRLDALVDAADGAIQVPGGDRQQRLDRNVELAAEAAAAGRRNNAYAGEREAEDARGLVAVHGGGLGAGGDLDAVADPLGPAGLGLDVGVLDEAGFEGALRRVGGLGEGGLRVAVADEAAGENIVRLVFVNYGRAFGQRRRDAVDRRQRVPNDRQVGSVDGLYRLAAADQGEDRLAAMAHMALGKHRLVLEIGIDAEGILARHILGGENALDAGMAGEKGRKIADGETGGGVRRAHRL